MHIKDLREFYVGGYGSKANPKVSILNPNITTLHLRTGLESKVMVIDVDEPYSEQAKAVRNRIRRDDFIVYSTEYTLQDVFDGKCRFKVFYAWEGDELPKKKLNKAVEIMYKSSYLGAFQGKRDDGYEYRISSLSKGEIKPLHFDINDVVEVKIDQFDFFNRKKATKTKKSTKEKKHIEVDNHSVEDGVSQESDIVGYDKVDIIEFQKLLMELSHLVTDVPEMRKRGDVITFNCLFPDEHSDLKGANAYAVKRDGVYFARCHGNVCTQRYWELNKALKELAINRIQFDNAKGFGEFKESHVLFKAPTGWGKTEAIAEEALKAINDQDKVLILLQSKEAIARLSDRINMKSNGAFETLYQMGKIYIYTSENKDSEHEIAVERANVIISHHYYFNNAGNILTYYKDSMEILKQDGLKLIIDEAHTFVELASRLDLVVGGLYEKDEFAGMESWKINYKSLKREALSYDTFKVFTKCLFATMNDYGSIELRKETRLYPTVEYLDLVEVVESSENFEIIDFQEQGEEEYYVYENNDVKPVKENNLENETDGLQLLTDSAERIIITKSVGDDNARKQLGRITFTAFHTQILRKVLTEPNQVILTTATWEDYHQEIVSKLVDLYHHVEEGTIEKIGKIILLRASERKPAKIRKKVLETTNDLNSRALLFFPTIAKAREIAKDYDNIMLNDNGMYSIGKRKSSLDYLDNFVRNVTVAGLESSVAKGYNYLEEVDGNTDGFELIYFDKKPVSPVVMKKYFNNKGELQDYESDYKWSAFAQAIGRAFRRQKETLCVAINDIADEDYKIIKKYLESETKAVIIEDELNVMNLKIAIPSFIKSVGLENITEQLKDNKLFKRIYLNGEKKDE